MESVIFVSINIALFIFLIYLIIKFGRKNSKLKIAIDYYSTVNDGEKAKEDYVSDVLVYDREYDKTVGLKGLLTGDRKEYYKVQLEEDTAREVGLKLLKSGAIDIRFITDGEVDFIRSSIKYLIPIV